MRHKLFALIAITAVTVLTGCFDGDSSPSPSPSPTPSDTAANGVTKALETNVIPTLNNDVGLTIRDTDNNSVRDDVDALIRRKYTAAAHIKAATQYAQAMQMEVAASAPAASDVPSIAMALTKAVDCAVAQMGAASAAAMIAEVRAATANTRERFMAYRETEAALSGQHAVITEDDPKTFCK